ncbi:hypothetical protein M0R88_07020 [Halorussus gelatinilyticus]|uniref:Uncharacterized protein n=1 Tax=Halorussus gelatinilyticus TaxID=2937524 RepID=A0A8U0IPA7_9EURY|nr:hypothetical protein [Halorussus gelatinilyticus]UPW01839.1 hypothetical protein M0R88_07020 [Halorussus gelatinilyticus]
MSSGGSDETADGGAMPAPVKKIARTVTPPYRGRPDAEMTTIGIAYGLGLVVLLIPLLPFIVVVWVVSKITGFLARKAPTDRLP